MRKILTLAAGFTLAAAVSGCGSDDGDDAGAPAADGASAEAPHVVVTTNVLGDVVTAAFGDLVDVEVIMPPGADPHEFAASAKQATAMEEADLLVINGAGFEAGLDAVLDSVAAGGTPTFSVAEHVQLLYGAEHDQAEEEHPEEGHPEEGHPEEEHAEEEHAEADRAEADHEGETDGAHAENDEPGEADPHLWTDPILIGQAVTALGPVIGGLPGVDPELAAERAAAYVALATDLNAEIDRLLTPIPEEDRVMVTNHEVFGYFAERYGFEVAGAVVPSLTTNAQSSAKELEDLAALLETFAVPVIFAETTQSTQLAEALVAAVGSDVQIVELYTESLGEAGSGADTYLGMMRTNAQMIADALLGGS
jgi:zinc/manganese transport system substrate-binding protein